MSSLSVVFRFITLSLLICSLQGWTISTPENLTKKINKCVDSLTKAVKFCSRRYRNFTIDSLYELAILRDLIGSICRAESLPPNINARICTLSKLIEDSFAQMNDYIMSSSLRLLFLTKWYAFDYQKNTAYFPRSYTEISLMNHKNCLLELTNGSDDNCFISENCENIYFDGMHGDFQLTRQLFYYQALIRSNCQSRNRTKMDISRIISTICYSVTSDFDNVYTKRNLRTYARSILLEQIVYCGLGGFLQLTHPALMEEIILWQDPSGCFKAVPKKRGSLMEEKKGKEYAEIDPPINDGCLPHLTSMALGALGMHLYRFAIVDGFLPNFHSILLKENHLSYSARQFLHFVPQHQPPEVRSKEHEARPYAVVPDTVL